MRTICRRVFPPSARGASTFTDCPSLVLSHTRRGSCRKSRQAEPEILRGPNDAQPEIQHPHIPSPIGLTQMSAARSILSRVTHSLTAAKRGTRWPWTAFHEQGRLRRLLTPLPGPQASRKPSQTFQVTKCLEEKQKNYLFVRGHITSEDRKSVV